MTLFTLKYQPKMLAQIHGQDLAVAQLKDYVLNYKKQIQKAALLLGPIGTGKTAAVFALAQELGYDLLELNSSDIRNEEAIKTFLGAALGQQSLFFVPKVILIDEVDNISGVMDRGCLPALLKAIATSRFPVILTANEVSDSKFKALNKEVLTIEFHKLQYRSIVNALTIICQQEGIAYDEKALSSLARQADGDLRAALIDLEICAAQGKITFETVTSLSDRKRTQTILNALSLIFKSSSAQNALSALEDVDCEPNEVMLWLDANLPLEYKSAQSLAKAYEMLARADVFEGRIRKRQHWRFLAYINDLLTGGISSSKEEKNHDFVVYKPTMRLLRIWQMNQKLAKKKEIATKLAHATHSSKRIALREVGYLQPTLKQKEVAAQLDLSDDEREWLEK